MTLLRRLTQGPAISCKWCHNGGPVRLILRDLLSHTSRTPHRAGDSALANTNGCLQDHRKPQRPYTLPLPHGPPSIHPYPVQNGHRASPHPQTPPLSPKPLDLNRTRNNPGLPRTTYYGYKPPRYTSQRGVIILGSYRVLPDSNNGSKSDGAFYCHVRYLGEGVG